MRLSFLLGYPDSNQERQDQNLQCYHYTIAQYICSKAVQRYCFFVEHKFFGIFFVHTQSEIISHQNGKSF